MHNTYHTKLEKRQKIAVLLKNRKIYSIDLVLFGTIIHRTGIFCPWGVRHISSVTIYP